MRITLPTGITLFRIALIPLFVITFYLPVPWSSQIAAAIFGLACVSDWIDGYLARLLRQESAFGAFLDPVADKLIVVAAVILIVQAHPSIYIALPSIIIVAREISISALREWMAELGDRAAIKVSFIGKVKTTAQLFSLFLMVYSEPIAGYPVFQTGLVFYYVAAIFTIVSMVLYLKSAWPVIIKSG